jgi:hypothetical protein
MIGKPLFYLVLFVGSLFGLSASAVTTSKNVDIIVTHGAPLTTFTFVNNTGATLPAGTPVSMGQAFRYGDIMPGNYPVIRDATKHIALPGQQWDEISTWRENGGNGSWRHAVWAIWLPNSLAAGASYQIEFVPTAGTYSEISHQALSGLCSGSGAHDFKMHLADVRNQDDTVRDSGDATFRLCDNIANTGRDAPRHLRAGNVYDEYEVRGLFKYTSGRQDPLLYVTAVVDLFTDAADGTSLKDVRHVFTTHNSWMNVSAGSVGNPGAPGPAGFPNDPQILSYQSQILDGSIDILDWSGLTQTVSSTANPIQNGKCSNTWQGSLTLTVPGSTGTNTWFAGMPVRYSTKGTPIGGLTPGQLYWVYNCSSTVTSGADGTIVNLMNSPEFAAQVALPLTGSQGTGTHTFSYVTWHPPWQSWQDEDTSADQNWATRGSTARFTRRIYPAFTNAEKTYWQESGLVPPIYLGQPTPNVPVQWRYETTLAYNPFSKDNVRGNADPGERPDIGFINEWSAQAFVDGTQTNWYYSRLYTMGAQSHGASTLLDESTGRIPVLNNGPPTGPGGNGVGGSYGTGTNASVALGIPQNQTSWSGNYFHGITQPRQGVPNTLISQWQCGIWLNCGTYISHIPNFVSLSYLIFGERLYLDSTYFDPNRDLLQLPPGPGDSYRDDIIAGNHYWGLTIACCQGRGSAWALRDRTFAAASGGDGNVERQYFNDQITENMNYYGAWIDPYKSGPGNTNIQTSILLPDYPGSWSIPDTYIGAYIFFTAYSMQTFLHAIDFSQWIVPFTKFYEGVCGGQMAGHPVSFYCIDFTLTIAMYDGDHTTTGGGIGPYVNGTDASSFGNQQNGTNILSGGQLQYASGYGYYTLAPGDTVRNISGTYYNGGMQIDQLPGTQWFEVVGPVNNTNGTYYIKCPLGHPVTSTCPTPGAAFTDFTRSGVSIAGEMQDLIAYRPSFDPGPGVGYADNNYTKYGGMVMNGLTVLGQSVPNALSDFNTRGGPSFYNNQLPSLWWDPTVVVPGSP